MPQQLNRRELIHNAVLAGAGVAVSGHASLVASASPNEKLNIACIGLGNQGRANLGLVSSQNIVALCDVDDERTAMFGAKFPKACSTISASIPKP